MSAILPTESISAEPSISPNISPSIKPEYLQITLTTFLTVFIAEIGDKTQVTTLVMAAESHAPGIVFVGAAIALVSSSLLGTIAGRWLSEHLTPKLLNLLAGASFLLLSLGLVWDAVK